MGKVSDFESNWYILAQQHDSLHLLADDSVDSPQQRYGEPFDSDCDFAHPIQLRATVP